RLRVDPRLRGRRTAPHRRPDAPPARLRGPAPRPRGDPVLHGPPQAHRRTGRLPGLITRRAGRAPRRPVRPPASGAVPGAARPTRAAPGPGRAGDTPPGAR